MALRQEVYSPQEMIDALQSAPPRPFTEFIAGAVKVGINEGYDGSGAWVNLQPPGLAPLLALINMTTLEVERAIGDFSALKIDRQSGDAIITAAFARLAG